MGLMVPRLYAIVDAEVLKRRGVRLRKFAVGLRAAGVSLVQYRDKMGSPQEVLARAAVLREVFAETECRLILNDRADLAVLAGFDGVHVGQGDLSPEDARTVICDSNTRSGASPTHAMKPHEWGTRQCIWVGVSTHTEEQVVAANPMSQNRDMGHPGAADYVAIGPVFATGTKVDAEAVVGLEGVRRARALTTKPLVAIGGITRENARSVVEAGADSVAVVSGLFAEGESVEKVARDFLELLG